MLMGFLMILRPGAAEDRSGVFLCGDGERDRLRIAAQ
jgi:hypothetical protein